MAKLDLTLREANEAESYKLTTDQYDELKTKFENRFKERVSPGLKEAAKAELDRELRPSVRDELRPALTEEIKNAVRPQLLKEVEKELRLKLPEELRPSVEKDLRPKLLEEARKEIHVEALKKAREEVSKEVQSRVPSARERSAVRECVREIELDSLVAAHAAAEIANSAKKELDLSAKWRAMVIYLAPIGCVAAAYYLFERFGVYSPWMWVPLAVYAALYFLFLVNMSDTHTALRDRGKSFREFSSSYRAIAERAKQARLGSVELSVTRSDLEKIPWEISSSKSQTDRGFAVDATLLEESRQAVKAQLVNDIDPERLIRVTDSVSDYVEEQDREVARQSHAG